MKNSTKIFLWIGVIIAIIIIFLASSSDSGKIEKVGSQCHPSYSGCLKANASDYDCAGGSGNGPYYTGKIRVIGPDVFGLDRDGDGWGCE